MCQRVFIPPHMGCRLLTAVCVRTVVWCLHLVIGCVFVSPQVVLVTFCCLGGRFFYVFYPHP